MTSPHPRGFSDPGDAGLRQAARLSRQRGVGAEAEGGARPHPGGLYVRIRQRASRTALSRQCGDGGLRGRAREKCVQFLGAKKPEEIIFTRNATEAINLVAYTFGRDQIKAAGDEIVLLDHGAPLQHRAVALPARTAWCGDQMGAGRRRRQFPVLDAFEKLLTPRTQDGWRSPTCRTCSAPSCR